MTQPDLTNLYRTRTQARLQSAGLLMRNNPSCQFEATPEADLERSNIGMMIWSAAIDLGSVLMLQEAQTTPTGRSPQISQFITRILHPQLPQLRLNVAWSILVQLHNIQHRGRHDPIRFGTAAAEARWSIAILNHLLLPANQIDPKSYNWLARVRAQYVNSFRDEPPERWPIMEPVLLNAVIPNTGATPLHWAAQNHDDHAIDVMIDQGARVDDRDNSRQAPLHWAGRNGTPHTVSRLLHHGADVDDLANLGSPLHYAAGFNGYDTVEALINNQANVNRRDANEETPLHWAARWQHDAAVARLLIQAGSRRDAFSFNGQSPHNLAVVHQSYFADLLAI